MKIFFILLIFIFSNIASAENLNFKKIIDLKDPWGSTFIDENNLLITEKGGLIKLVNISNKKTNLLNHNLNFLEHGQGGLLDILFNDNSMINGFYLKEILNPSIFIYLLRDAVIHVAYHKRHGTRLQPQIIAKADFAVTNSDYFAEYAGQTNSNSFMIGQGCDLTMYNDDDGKLEVPEDLKAITKKPIIGYVGFLTTIRLDIEVLVHIAESRPDWSLVLVGPEDDDFKNSKLHELENVYFLGRKDPDQLAAYIKGFDVDDSTKELERSPSVDTPFSALAFKIMTDPFVGRLTFFRVYSGSVSTGDFIYNPTSGKKERVGRLMLMHSRKTEERKTVEAGEIAGMVGLKDTKTGHTLCDLKDQIILESMEFPDPVISVAVEPSSKQDQENLTVALSKLAEEDPTFNVKSDEDSGQTIISGMGELHLDIICDRLKREFKVNVHVGAPQVAYKESITDSIKHETKFVKQSGGRGQYAHVVIEIEPNQAGSGYEFEDKITGGKIPKIYINSVSAGIQEAMKTGVLAGYPLEDLKVKLVDGSTHDVDSNEMAFKIAGSMAFRDAAKKASPVLLEPIMALEVVVPEEYFGSVSGDITSRRGSVLGMDRKNNAQIIKSEVPLSGMFGYATDLRSMTQGRAVFTLQFAKYLKAPKSISQEVLEKYAGKTVG